MNPALLSPSHFTDSIPCITSCGILAVSDCDLVFVGPVAIFNPPDIGVRQYTFKESYIKALTCKPPLNNVTYTLNDQGIEMAKPGSAGTLTGLLTTNANVTSEAAMFHRNTPHTGRAALTLKKITWRFLVLGEHAPVVVHITASSEQEARAAMPPCCIAIFAARIMRGGSANA
ncbi:host cell division inhibitor Icd-like protein [Edwardsiella tarda]|uniref:host cell division inhibitor Icd-like protein n=2 Tax=Edwardsiella tarda TaxID=636 RepID=UPI00349F59F1